MAPRFGTSGLRGLVTDLTDGLCAGYTRAFLTVAGHDGVVLIGRDLRPSSKRIARAVAAGVAAEGLSPIDCGELPTPALALAAMARGAPSIMVTGSHIPADRNGLKFYTPHGEITKADENAILAAYAGEAICPPVQANHDTTPIHSFLDRAVACLEAGALTGLRVGVYQHSSVARGLLVVALERLGAQVTPLGYANDFVPVDTEAVSAETRSLLRDWAGQHDLDAIVSTDGDADRPLVTDARGEVIPGDVIGLLTARAIGATHVVTPVSSNTMIEASGAFATVIRTRIGSPFVIAAMEAAMRETGACVAGFEANGGFLLGFEARLPSGSLSPLMTRDAFLPIVMPLSLAASQRKSLSGLIADLPARATASDRLTGVETEASQALVGRLIDEPVTRAAFFDRHGPEATINLTDGLRITFRSGVVVHLRPSGNAPELRCYAEAGDTETAAKLVQETLMQARNAISSAT